MDQIGQLDLAAARPRAARSPHHAQPVAVKYRLVQIFLAPAARCARERELNRTATQFTLYQGLEVGLHDLECKAGVQSRHSIDNNGCKPVTSRLGRSDAQFACSRVSQ